MSRLVLVFVVVGCGQVTAPDAGQPPDIWHVGRIELDSYQQLKPGAAWQDGTIAARFSRLYCTDRVVGTCTIYGAPCELEAPPPMTAGDIEVTGARVPITLSPSEIGYPEIQTDSALFTGGETLTATAAGDYAPPFTMSVVAPVQMQIASPVKQGSFAISRDKDLTIAWSGGTSGIEVWLDAGSTGIRCDLPRGGTGTIPSAVLGLLPPGQGGYEISAISETRTIVDAADTWEIEFVAAFNALWPDGTNAGGTLMVL